MLDYLSCYCLLPYLVDSGWGYKEWAAGLLLRLLPFGSARHKLTQPVGPRKRLSGNNIVPFFLLPVLSSLPRKGHVGLGRITVSYKAPKYTVQGLCHLPAV